MTRSINIILLFIFSIYLTTAGAQEWIEDKKGCKVWSQNPQPNESVKWSGKCVDGYASGKGKLTWINDGKPADEYVGEMQRGKPHGQGEYKYSYGGIFKGQFKDGLRHGSGTISDRGGKKFIFQYENGEYSEVPTDQTAGVISKSSGKLLMYGDNEKYDKKMYQRILVPGKWIELMDNTVYVMNSKVAKNLFLTKELANVVKVKTRPDTAKDISAKIGYVLLSKTPFQEQYNADRGLIMAGCISGNCKNGTGIYFDESGGKYMGEFKGGEYEGKGIYKYNSGTVVEGDFKLGKMNGKGKITYTSGNKYEGQFKDDKYDGHGTFIWKNKSRYVGGFKDGKREGEGKMTYNSGGMYEGGFKDGKMHGKGFRKYKNGNTYNGEYKHDRREGRGAMYYKDGRTEEVGMWKSDAYFGPLPDKDMDNIPDVDDECPDLYGPASNKGCPEATAMRESTGVHRGSGDPLKGLNVAKTAEMKIGLYYALIIGIDKYSGQWAPLNNAVRDASSIKDILSSKYRFDHFQTLFDEQATRENIINEFVKLVGKVKEDDNVVIFYSGHGEFQKDLNRGYWVPSDAQTTSISKYISNADIQTFLGGIKARHTLLISDACFSGDIFRGNTFSIPFEDSDNYFRTVYYHKSCQAITSGGIEPVLDDGKDGHSVFTYYLLKALKENENKFFDAVVCKHSNTCNE